MEDKVKQRLEEIKAKVEGYSVLDGVLSNPSLFYRLKK